jgi:hypothetical protein
MLLPYALPLSYHYAVNSRPPHNGGPYVTILLLERAASGPLGAALIRWPLAILI